MIRIERLGRVLLAAFLVLASVGLAQARQVQVFLPQEEGKEASAPKEEALKKGFVQALLDESQDLLSPQVFESRKALIGASLAPRANNYILSYSETARESVDKGVNLTLEVAVNRTALKKTLGEMGIYKADAAAPGGSGVVLNIEGWRAPEGIPEVDRLLNGMDRFIESAKLLDVSLDPAKVRARWDVRIIDREGLEKKLQEVLQPRGLSWSIG